MSEFKRGIHIDVMVGDDDSINISQAARGKNMMIEILTESDMMMLMDILEEVINRTYAKAAALEHEEFQNG